MHVSFHRYWTFKHLEKSLNILKHTIAQTIFASWATFQDIAPPPRKPRHPGDPRSLEHLGTRFDMHADAFRSTCMGVWHWLRDGFHEIDFSQPFRCDTLDVTLMWLCAFQRLRPSDVFFEIPSPIFDWSDDQFVFSTIGGNQFVSSSNQLDRLLWAVGCCSHGLKQRLPE